MRAQTIMDQNFPHQYVVTAKTRANVNGVFSKSNNYNYNNNNNNIIIIIMKVKYDHRSKFSNLSNWKEEA